MTGEDTSDSECSNCESIPVVNILKAKSLFTDKTKSCTKEFNILHTSDKFLESFGFNCMDVESSTTLRINLQYFNILLSHYKHIKKVCRRFSVLNDYLNQELKGTSYKKDPELIPTTSLRSLKNKSIDSEYTIEGAIFKKLSLQRLVRGINGAFLY